MHLNNFEGAADKGNAGNAGNAGGDPSKSYLVVLYLSNLDKLVGTKARHSVAKLSIFQIKSKSS